MNTMQTDHQWFIAREGQQHGPVSDVEIRKLAELGHLRPSDLVWRQGFTDWRPAVAVFPPAAAEPAPVQAAPVQASPVQAQPATQPVRQEPQVTGRPAGVPRPATIEPRRPAQPTAQPQRPNVREQLQPFEVAENAPKSSKKNLVMTALVLAMLGGATWLVLRARNTTGSAPSVATVSTDKAATAPETVASIAASNTNKPLDSRLQKIPAWQTVKRSFPQWYEERLKEAEDLTNKGKSDAEVDKHLVGELVKLRRQHAKDALSAPPEHLKGMAAAFLENLKSLETVGVPACYAFISRGEVTGVVVEMLHAPDVSKGQQISAQIVTIFNAIAAGKKSPTKHDPPQKPDYDVLAAELGKLGWTQGDMQLFADPKSLATAPPARVCSMVQDWFKAHLAVSDAGVQERLLFETLKPVVGG